MTKKELSDKLQGLSKLFAKIEDASLQLASYDLLNSLNQRHDRVDENDQDEMKRLDSLINNVTIAVNSSSSADQKMTALIAIQDEINRVSLKAHVLEATAALAKTLEMFVCVAWFSLWTAALGAFYVATFPFGMIVDFSIGVAANRAPPLADACLSIGWMPFSASEPTFFKSVEHDKSFVKVTQDFKAEVKKTLLENKDAEPESTNEQVVNQRPNV